MHAGMAGHAGLVAWMGCARLTAARASHKYNSHVQSPRMATLSARCRSSGRELQGMRVEAAPALPPLPTSTADLAAPVSTPRIISVQRDVAGAAGRCPAAMAAAAVGEEING